MGSGLGDGLGRTLEIAAGIDAVAGVAIEYDREEDAPLCVQQALPELDALLFLGPVPHVLSRGVLPPSFPATHIPYDGSGLVRALFDLHRLFGEDIPFSIDSIREPDVLAVADEVGARRDHVHALQGTSDELLPRDVLVAGHVDLARRGVTRAAVTYMRSVQFELERHGLTIVSVKPLASTVRNALRQTASLALARSLEASQLVVVLVRLEIAGDQPAGARRQLALAAQSLLLRLADRLEATLADVESGVYSLITTKGGLDRSPSWEVVGIRELEGVGELIGAKPTVGIGFGSTSREAEENAQHALARADRESGQATFVVFRDRTILGPLGGSGEAVLRTTRVSDAPTLALARAAGVNSASIALLQSLGGGGVFDAEKLARLLGVSVRGARRIAVRLVDAGLAESAGAEQLHGRGRPRQLYRLRPVVPETTKELPADPEGLPGRSGTA